MKKTLVYLIIFFLIGNLNAQNKSPIYSFFTAGHTYGKPGDIHYGLHYPFVDFIPTINNFYNVEVGILTGDVVVSPTAAYWDSAQIDIAKLDMPIFIAAGNHDVGAEFLERFGSYYSSFIKNNDLFIILCPNKNTWNIDGLQLEFLINTLENNYADVNNIFIFLHELIWWSPTNIYQNVAINYVPYYPGSTNFDDIIKPLLLSYSNNITIYAGDLGCTTQVSPFMYHSFDNITLIGSGMGGGLEDNIIITEIYEDSIYYNLIAINGENPNALGELSDFTLGIESYSENYIINNIKIYPNPASDYFQIKNNSFIDFEVRIFNLRGELIQSGIVKKNSIKKYSSNKMPAGIYFIQFESKSKIYYKKLVVN